MRVDARLPVLPGPASADRGAGGTTPAPRAARRSYGPQSAPPELLAFVRLHPPCDAARALGLSRRTVCRLAQGYWPADARAVMHAWVAYTGRIAAPASRWFMRLVRPGGLVRHGCGTYTGHCLAQREGQLVAVARAADGSLLAQTLELPSMRLPLAAAPELRP